MGQGFMIGGKEATKLKIQEIHFNTLEEIWNVGWIVFDSSDFRDIQFLMFLYLFRYYMTSLCDGIPVFVWILHEFHSLIMVMVCYSITRLGYIYTASYYPVNIERDIGQLQHMFYMIWINITASDCSEIPVHWYNNDCN